MKSPKLTIGKRVGLGFASVLITATALLSFLVHEMNLNAAIARFTAGAVATQTKIITQLSNFEGSFRLSARTYSLTGETSFREEALKIIPAMSESIEKARQHSQAYPELIVLKEGIPQIEKAFKTIVSQFKATDENLTARAKLSESLSSTGGDIYKAIFRYVEDQEAKMSTEIDADSSSAKIKERYLKLKGGNEVGDLSAAIIKTLGNAERAKDPVAMDKAIALIPAVITTANQLIESSGDQNNRKALADFIQSVNGYRTKIEELQKNYAEGNAINAARIVASNDFEDSLDKIVEASVNRATATANAQSEGLASDARMTITFLILMVVGGATTAFLIIRGLNRALTVTSESVNKGAIQVASASSLVSSSSMQLAEGASEQAASLEEISSSLEELSSMTKRNAENAQSGKNTSAQARAAAESGAIEMERLQTAMGNIQQSSKEIAKIIKTIDEIAFQTNILALNAAVEAARAGEAGAGFAVVADEVRSLAQRSALASKETADKIEAASASSAQGVELSVRVVTGFRQILEKSREVDRLVSEVATASIEQSEGLMQINTAITQMDKVTQSNAANAEETSSAAQELNGQSQQMRVAADQLSALVGLDAVSITESASAVQANTKLEKTNGAAPRTPKRSSTKSPQFTETHAVSDTPSGQGVKSPAKALTLSFHD